MRQKEVIMNYYGTYMYEIIPVKIINYMEKIKKIKKLRITTDRQFNITFKEKL